VQAYAIKLAGEEIEGLGKNIQGKTSYYKTSNEVATALNEYLQISYVSQKNNFFAKHIKDFLDIFHIVYSSLQGNDDKEKMIDFKNKIKNIIPRLSLNQETILQTQIGLNNIITSINNIIQHSDSRAIIGTQFSEEDLYSLETNIYAPIYEKIYKTIQKNPNISYNFFYFKNLFMTQDQQFDDNYKKIKNFFDTIKIIVDAIPKLLKTIKQETQALEDEILTLNNKIIPAEKVLAKKQKELKSIYGKSNKNQLLHKNINKLKNIFTKWVNPDAAVDSNFIIQKEKDDAIKEIERLTDQYHEKKKIINEEYDRCKNQLNQITKLYQDLSETISQYPNSYDNNSLENFTYKPIWNEIKEIIKKIINLQNNTLFKKIIQTSNLPHLPQTMVKLLTRENDISYPVLYKILLISWISNIEPTVQAKLKKDIIENLSSIKFLMSNQYSGITVNQISQDYEKTCQYFANFLTMTIILHDLDHDYNNQNNNNNTNSLFINTNPIVGPINNATKMSKFFRWAKKLLSFLKLKINYLNTY